MSNKLSKGVIFIIILLGVLACSSLAAENVEPSPVIIAVSPTSQVSPLSTATPLEVANKNPEPTAETLEMADDCIVECIVQTNKNISYSRPEFDHPRHKLDIYTPEGLTNFPVLMFVSGGGWTSGSKDWVMSVGQTFAAQGIGVVAVDHRLMPDVSYSQQIEDLALALTWIKDNIAAYGGDSARVAIGGHSAGGHLISLLAMDEQYAPYDLSGVVAVSAALDVGDRFGKTAAEVEASSPLNQVRADLPPFLLLFAADDLPGLERQALTLEERLQQVSVPVQSALIPDRDHFNIIHQIGSPGDATTVIMGDWLKEIFK